MKSDSRLEKVLRSGAFAVTGELGPPKNSDPEIVRAKARILKGHVDAVNITDCQTAIVRMSSIGAGLITQYEGVEPVVQMTCRDRNRIGMQSDILGASALGLKNLLCLTGDHQKFGNHAASKGVFDMDSIQLLGMVRDMRDGKVFQCGEAIKGAEPKLFLGAAANPFAGPADFRAMRMGKKIENGADFIQTQIVYNVDKFAKFMEMAVDLGLPEKAFILAGVTPPRSIGMARYMKKFVPGMDVPDEIISRLQSAKDKEDEGINICVDIINQIKEIKGVAGVHVMAIEWESAVPEIVSRAGLSERPQFEDEPTPQLTAKSEEIIISTAPQEASSQESDQLLSAAKAEAEKIIAAARQQASEMCRNVDHNQITIEDHTGEDEMNERERQMALESVRLGLEALKKTFGLSDDQYEALASFTNAAAVLKREPASTDGAPSAPVSSAPAPAAPIVAVDDNANIAAEKAAVERKAAGEAAEKAKAAKEAEDAQKVANDQKAAEAAKIANADKAKKETAAKEAEEAQKAADAKNALEAEEAKKAADAPVTKSGSEPDNIVLDVEETPLAERASKVPADHYQQAYNGKIRETVLGSGDNAVTVGGTNSLPFQLFEGDMPSKTAIAMEIIDIIPEDWPEPLKAHFTDVYDNPVAWAQKCVSEFNAEAICFSLPSTDPNGQNRSSAEAAKDAAAVISALDVPVIIWGCGNADKDTETLREITSLIGDKKVCLAPLSDANYRTLGATAMAFQHPIVAASPIDVNLAKQLNILLENLGVSLDTVMMDPSVGALGYGIEYTYSVMERIRIAALTQQDEKLQVPFICNLGREVWKAKECRLPSDELLGDQETRGVMMEALTASIMTLCGGDLLIMRHPRAISLTKTLVAGLMG